MTDANARKSAMLGMPVGTAFARLRKAVLFDAVTKLKENFCFRCKQEILLIEEFTIEHKNGWQLTDNPAVMFFDLKNIAYSHYSCNIGAATKIRKHATKKEREQAHYQNRKNRLYYQAQKERRWAKRRERAEGAQA